MLRRRAATIILRKRRRIGLQCALLRSQTICSTMLGTRQLLLVEVPHARMRSEWHQLRRQLMQQQQHGKAINYSNMPHCLRRAADPPFYPVSWVPTPPLSGKAAVYSSGSARAQRTRERKKKIKQRRQICCSAKVIEKSLWRHVETTALSALLFGIGMLHPLVRDRAMGQEGTCGIEVYYGGEGFCIFYPLFTFVASDH